MTQPYRVKVEVPGKLAFLFPGTTFVPSRFKVLYGGRGGLKTWQIARALILHSMSTKLRVLCARETLKSISESVHHELETQIALLGVEDFFTIENNRITCNETGSEFIFRGLRIDPASLKSLSDIDIVWVEEAAQVSLDSWRKLIPTIRKSGSEIWISFNPEEETDPVYVRFIVGHDKNAIVVQTGWQDNPWLSQEMLDEKDVAYATDVEEADHVWGGRCIKHSKAEIFAGRCIVQDFTPEPSKGWLGPFYGIDFGFAQDPFVLIKLWVFQSRLYVEEEVFGVGVDLNLIPNFMTQVSGWWRFEVDKQTGKQLSTKIPLPNVKLIADNSKPEQIVHLQNMGCPVVACKKWPGSVEDGIAVLKMFTKIVLHPRLHHKDETKQGIWNERRLYKYKQDKVSGEVLNIIVDKFNHSWDAIRYALEDVITNTEQTIITEYDSVKQSGVEITPELDDFENNVAAFGGLTW